MTSTLPEREWKVLLQRIKDGNCTPFLGAGACYGALPLGGVLARQWARDYEYPLEGADDLIKVSQFVALLYDQAFPKEEIARLFRKLRDRGAAGADVPDVFRDLKPPDFREPDEPHGVLARLPLPVYMTTNYDDFMSSALKDRMRDVRRDYCRWSAAIEARPSVFETEPDYAPTPARPLVFHLHGCDDVPGSLVLTEDDYLGFLAGMVGRQDDLLPARIREAVASSSLLFIGYRLADTNFRVLFQGLRPPRGAMTSLVVMVPPDDDSPDKRDKAKEYLDHYYGAMKLSVYWGTARAFCKELWERYQKTYGPS